MVEIRNFNETDVGFIYDNWAENPRWDGCKFNKDKLGILSLINEFNEKSFENKYFEQFVIVYNGELVGMISLYEQNSDEVSIGIYVHEDYRRKGIASSAYELANKVAKEKGYKLLSAGVAEENYVSINLHLKLGFKKDKVYENFYQKNQIRFIKEI